MDCSIVMERVLFFRSTLSFRHAPRATSLSEGGSIAPRETVPTIVPCCAKFIFSNASSTAVAVPLSRCGSVTLGL